MTGPRILVVGSGGREHALAWRLAQDVDPASIITAPGNDAIGRTFARRAVAETDVEGLVKLARSERVDLVVIGPETPLALGLADALAATGIAAFGPVAAAARIEASKWFAKTVMEEAGVPTARAEAFESADAACLALERFGPPWVIKADGLAAGKGVLVTEDRAAALRFLGECLAGDRFGVAGSRVVLEEFLAGEELSVMAVCDGRDAMLLPAARDFKRAGDGDAGPNTGGMGAFAPAPLDRAEAVFVRERIALPMLGALAARGTPYRGALYCGLMRTAAGLRVVEFNARFGDPETEAILPLVGGSFARLLASAAAGALDESAVRDLPGATLSVALVASEYPERGAEEAVIEGVDELMPDAELLVFGAAARRGTGAWRGESGRLLHVAAYAPSSGEARARVYAAIARLGGHGWRCRSDIGTHEASDRTVAAGGAHGTKG